MTRPRADPPQRPEEILVHDRLEACPYLPNAVARMPLRLQLSQDEGRLDEMLSRGERRVGPMMYRTSCPACSACIPIRIPVALFVASRSQKRAWKQNLDLRIEEGPAYVDEERLRLFNRHRMERSLSTTPIDARGYVAWLVHSWTETREIAMYLGDELICVTIIDNGLDSTSAVYCYYSPDYPRRSLGIFSILQGIERCLQMEKTHHYLGLYVAENHHLNYKTRFLPNEQLVGDEWVIFEEP